MKLPRRKFLHLAAGAAALPAVSRIARAQAYPTRAITMVVPFAPGGGASAIARILAERMRVTLGQPLIIENVGGANGSIGVGRVARSRGDGYTLVLGLWNTHVANSALYALSYDVTKDFEPVSLFASNPLLIVAKNAVPADDLKGLIAWLKANPGKASQGHPGVGSPGHIGGVLFQNMTNTSFQFVPYRGSGPAMQDLVAGQINMMIEPPTASLPQVRAGTIKVYAVTAHSRIAAAKVYAVTAHSRIAAAPDIPTVDEAGLPAFYLSNWYALFAPRGTPRNVIDTLNAAVVEALADPEVRSRLAAQGQELPTRDQQTPEALAALQKADVERWVSIIKAANIKGE
jgi:tripartite-type tricarboxylate transporter receptor subunit TctC